MSIFRKKKRLFGNNITPSCEYCSHNHGKKEIIKCSLQLNFDEGNCKKFIYNPLMRIPQKQLLLKKDEFDADDFSL